MPQTRCHISYNIHNNIPNLKVKLRDYEAIRELVENDGDRSANKIDSKKLMKQQGETQLLSQACAAKQLEGELLSQNKVLTKQSQKIKSL